MKRLLIIPATVALLTGLSATAQDSNENADGVKSPAPVLYTTDNASNLDGMTIAQLNAMQLERLQMADNGDSTFQVASSSTSTGISGEMESMTSDTAAPAQADSKMAATMSTETVTPYADTEASEMGGPDYKSEADAMNHADMPGTIAQVAMDDARFTTLVSLIKLAGLDAALMNDGPYTVFAPTNAAFDRLDPKVVAHLTSEAGKAELKKLLKGHVVEGKYLASDIEQGETDLMTLASTNLDIERVGDMVTADNIDVVSTDIDASNGVIHVVDQVITDPANEAEDMSKTMDKSMDMSGQ
ncbi:MAG: fasciclin domain-containing protein [Alphaproteobacteria bacterium]|nr:fasciclin domain-containing protein [Alphaproteobacteria bacterium]MBU2084867.1 fasciclin domain-containing protein [Alphaproteobacteria bacterium]MBU2144055.1 fasciclin domain-containing protein [Alphaproteobacteria bacterium]MBU2198170.1 fasciclin domain-containing protein [Alphaproteobacteria bacterium]